ncbi:ABC transporter ATP-binding protein [Phormidium sp. CLA17]|uniref:ABC transporter ATP-binding protein n=1 Tax=Leptolyngbya sp. Cla-17 TaxID=2803751 RepID=UPI0014927914|nr:ABC transporter ATP-binding protein [Leptolyngbya sp. Cla-17]MBM0744004.1 ABC transporter ATP-binding protein [Leptolyngbya sp. Cla-17]
MQLQLNSVTTGYGSLTVLRQLSLQVSQGEILGVLGRNGMGKTTLIRCLSGLLPTQSGSIWFDGREITQLKPHRRAQLGITTVVQGRGIFSNLTVRENLEMGRIASGRARRDRQEEVLTYFERLGERLDQVAGTLSGGEQQMLAIGRGLMTEPKLMLLDEPSEGIMPILVKQIAQILQEINRREQMMIIIVEQNVPMVFSMATHCILLEKGQIVAEGVPADLAHSEVMTEYLAI